MEIKLIEMGGFKALFDSQRSPTIRRILQQRDPHLLPEFEVVCDFFKSLPLAAELLLV
jgi:hypothetical protein